MSIFVGWQCIIPGSIDIPRISGDLGQHTQFSSEISMASPEFHPLLSGRSIVFSPFCYFVEDERRFVVVFANTTDMPLVNAEMCSLVKMGRGDWVVHSPYKSPYVGGSAWTFAIASLRDYDRNFGQRDSGGPLKVDLSGQKIFDDDGVKFGISGSYEFASFSAAVKYKFDDVWVIPRRSSLDLETFRMRRLWSRRFRRAFYSFTQDLRTPPPFGSTRRIVEPNS